MKIEIDMYKHKLEDDCLKDMKKAVFCEETFINYHKNFIEEAILPDLIGNSIKVTEKQFGKIFSVTKEMCNVLNIGQPDIYVYEDFCYAVSAEGLNKPWIQISASTIEDFNKDELKFLIGRELAHIKSGHMYWKILMKQCINAPKLISNVPGAGIANLIGGIEGLEMGLKIIMYKWNRVSEYSSDACGYLLCRNMEAAISSIKKLILNNKFLAKELNLSEYIKQGELLEDCTSNMAKYSKLDEIAPYGPFRIKELLRFASSSKTKEIIKELRDSEN